MGAVKSVCCFCCPQNEEEEATDSSSKYGIMSDESRKTRDVLFCIIFALFWVGMIIIGSIGLAWGRPSRLVFGTDYRGEVCGSDSSVKDRRYTAYPRVNEDFLLNYGNFEFYGVCVSQCPGAMDVVCNEEINRNEAPYENETDLFACVELGLTGDADQFDGPEGFDCPKVSDNCWIIPQRTRSVLFRCIPVYQIENDVRRVCVFPSSVEDADDPNCVLQEETRNGTIRRPAQPNILFDQLNSAGQVWGRYFGDLARTWWVILVCSIVIGLLLGFIWLFFLKWCTGIMVWVTIILVFALLVALTIFCFIRGGVIDADTVASLSDAAFSDGDSEFQQSLATSEDNEQAFRVMGYVLVFAILVSVGLIVVMRSKIKTAIKTIRMAAAALQDLPSMMLLPVTTVVALLALLCWWVFVAASLASAQKESDADVSEGTEDAEERLRRDGFDPDENPALARSLAQARNQTFTVWEDEDALRYMLIYHFFGLLWTNQFLQGIALMTIAISTAGWYFSRNKDEAESAGVGAYELKDRPVWNAVKLTVRYYLGSIALASLLIAIVQFIRAVMAYVQRMLRERQDYRIIQFIMSCVQLCLRCIEWCLKVVSRNAYVYIAIKGGSFCGSAGSALAFIISNLGVFAMVNFIAEALMLLGKVFIAGIAAFVAFWITDSLDTFQEGGSNELASQWLPVLVTFIFAYGAATAFFSVFDMTVDTLLICYVMDRNDHKTIHGHARAVHAESLTIGETLDDFQKEQDAEDDEKQGLLGGSGSGGEQEMSQQNPISK